MNVVVGVGVGVDVAVGVGVGVLKGTPPIGVTGVFVTVGVKVLVGVGVLVGVEVLVGVDVGSGVDVFVGVGVEVLVAVAVAVSVGTAVFVGVAVDVSLGTGVSVGAAACAGVYPLAVTTYAPIEISGTRNVAEKVPLHWIGAFGEVAPIMVTTATALPPWQLKPVPLTVIVWPGLPSDGLRVIAGLDAAILEPPVTVASLRPGRASAAGIMSNARAVHQRFINPPP